MLLYLHNLIVVLSWVSFITCFFWTLFGWGLAEAYLNRKQFIIATIIIVVLAILGMASLMTV